MNTFAKRTLALSAALAIGLACGFSVPGYAGAEGASGSGHPAAAPSDSHDPSHEGHKLKRHGKGHFILKESSKLFDMDCSALSESLNSGKSLADIAKDKKGWSKEQYVQKLAEAAGSRIDKGVAEGRFTQEQANKLKAGLPAMLKARVSEKGPLSGHHPSRKPAESNH